MRKRKVDKPHVAQEDPLQTGWIEHNIEAAAAATGRVFWTLLLVSTYGSLTITQQSDIEFFLNQSIKLPIFDAVMSLNWFLSVYLFIIAALNTYFFILLIHL